MTPEEAKKAKAYQDDNRARQAKIKQGRADERRRIAADEKRRGVGSTFK